MFEQRVKFTSSSYLLYYNTDKNNKTTEKQTMNDKGERRLTYSNQMEFKSWARKHGLTQKNGARYYFDSVFAVHDNGIISQDTIRGVIANGSLTWSEALHKLKLHFGIGVSLTE